MHDRLVTFREWQEAMEGDIAGEYEVDSWNVYCLFMGWPHMGQPTTDLANFFTGLQHRVAMQPVGLHLGVEF